MKNKAKKTETALVALLAIIFLAPAMHSLHAADPAPATGKEWKKFEGAWFEVLYPADFTPEPSLKSKTEVNGHDSAFFLSPAKDVEFYVFSPQWNGNPDDILLKEGTEDQVSFQEVEKEGKVIRICTIAAKDGSYTRSYVDTEDPKTNSRLVFGIRYRDQEAFAAFKDRYRKFRESLVQFAD